MEEGKERIGKALIEEHLAGQHTVKQLETLLKREGLTLKGMQKGKGNIRAVISDGRYRKEFKF